MQNKDAPDYVHNRMYTSKQPRADLVKFLNSMNFGMLMVTAKARAGSRYFHVRFLKEEPLLDPTDCSWCTKNGWQTARYLEDGRGAMLMPHRSVNLTRSASTLSVSESVTRLALSPLDQSSPNLASRHHFSRAVERGT